MSAFSVLSFHLAEKEQDKMQAQLDPAGWASIPIRLKPPLNSLLGCALGTWRGASCSQWSRVPEGQGLLETEGPFRSFLKNGERFLRHQRIF